MPFTLHDLPLTERPRERLVEHGAPALSTQELLQIILGKGIKGESVSITAQKLLAQFGDLEALEQASLKELQNLHGVGLAKACQIKAAFELGRRLNLPKTPTKRKLLENSNQVFQLLKNKIPDNTREHFYLITLDSRGVTVVENAIGTLNTSIVHPREVFSQAIKHHAAAIILAHNHPSGDPQPSDADLILTRRMVEAGQLMGIEVVDHVIIGKTTYFSFKDSGLIKV